VFKKHPGSVSRRLVRGSEHLTYILISQDLSSPTKLTFIQLTLIVQLPSNARP